MLGILYKPNTNKYIQTYLNTVYPNIDIYIYIYGSLGFTTFRHHQVGGNDVPPKICMIIQLCVTHMCVHTQFAWIYIYIMAIKESAAYMLYYKRLHTHNMLLFRYNDMFAKLNAADPNLSIAKYMRVRLRREYTGTWWNMHVVAFFLWMV